MTVNVPEKIYVSNYSSGPTYNWHNERLAVKDIEYIRTDAFIEKAKEFIWSHTEGSDYHVDYVLKEFEKYMKGE